VPVAVAYSIVIINDPVLEYSVSLHKHHNRMRRSRQHRTPRKAARLPAAHAFATRLTTLRSRLEQDAPEAGDQALKLLEEYLEQLASSHGYADEGSMRRYTMFLRGRNALPEDLLARIDTYTDARNCLAHTYGLQATPALAEELIAFLEDLLAEGDPTAERLMNVVIQSIGLHDSLAAARDLMLSGDYSRLPVLDSAGRVAGLLIERDIVAAYARKEGSRQALSAMSVADALPRDALDRVVFADPHASRAEILALLRQPGAVACLVTSGADPDRPPLGIITHADLLYRIH
jgi:CBS domain-containing protein